ncbi:hypothetical protein CEXT_531481 [Caerostris extrusa]|uniref:Uncharacterized protein n=1 Tax=Caerostris extrusa TaxID=172846 RepID=A0AAV4W8G9_CAEEX|nr:hypothetical protein CEXT_531481 [Caerostris extrusa]
MTEVKTSLDYLIFRDPKKRLKTFGWTSTVISNMSSRQIPRFKLPRSIAPKLLYLQFSAIWTDFNLLQEFTDGREKKRRKKIFSLPSATPFQNWIPAKTHFSFYLMCFRK